MKPQPSPPESAAPALPRPRLLRTALFWGGLSLLAALACILLMRRPGNMAPLWLSNCLMACAMLAHPPAAGPPCWAPRPWRCWRPTRCAVRPGC